jgi:hypothetical protein
MRIRRVITLGAALAVFTGGATVAWADTLTPDTTSVTVTAAQATRTVSITLVATDDATWNGDDADPNPGYCNLRGNGQYVTASVTSSNTNVATVSPATLTFNDCGESYPITITRAGCGTATVTVRDTDDNTAGGPHARFSDAIITVNAGACDGGDGGMTTCAQPAAPAWAAAILKANGIKPGSKTSTNLISQVAKRMLKGAAFPDGGGNPIAKSDQDAYAAAVDAYLGGLTTLTKHWGDTGVARPGWECTVTPAPSV